MEVVGNSIQGDLWFDSTRPGNLVLPSLETPFPPRASAAATRVAHLPAGVDKVHVANGAG